VTTARHDPDEPATRDLHDQWAAARLDALQEGFVDLVGVFLVIEDGAQDAPAAPGRRDQSEARPPQRSR
jgi:hypothetical protein